VDIFDAIAPTYGAQSVESQAERLVAFYRKEAPSWVKRLNEVMAPFPRKGLVEAVQARLDLVLSSKAVRR